MKQLYRILKSLKLTAIILTSLTITSLLATLVPQGLAPDLYRTLIPSPLQPLFFFLSYGNFFTSPLFLAQALLFGINLGTCTIHRLVIQWGRAGKNWGPDILHVGLLILLGASLVTAFGRQETTLALTKGMKVPLPEGLVLDVQDVAFVTYEDGRPREWRTAGVIAEETGSQPFTIKVNQPLTAGGLTFYQYSYEERWVATLEDHGEKLVLPEGTATQWKGRTLSFQGPVSRVDSGIMVTGAGMVLGGEPLGMAPGDSWEGLSLTKVALSPVSILKAAVDPGFPWVVAAFSLCILGMIMIVWKKIQEI